MKIVVESRNVLPRERGRTRQDVWSPRVRTQKMFARSTKLLFRRPCRTFAFALWLRARCPGAPYAMGWWAWGEKDAGTSTRTGKNIGATEEDAPVGNAGVPGDVQQHHHQQSGLHSPSAMGSVLGSVPRYASPKGRISTRHERVSARDASVVETEREVLARKRASARRSARAVAEYAKLHPMKTTRPINQGWKGRPDDFQHSYPQGHIHELWGDVERITDQWAGRPPIALVQAQTLPAPAVLGMTDKQRAWQLEAQLQAREERRRQAEKAKAEEKRVAQQLAQRNSQIAWHRKQRERQKKGLSRGERKQVQALSLIHI